MKMKALILLFLASSAWALDQHYTPWPPNGMNYVDRSACPGDCYPLLEEGVLHEVGVLDLKDVEEDDGAKPIYQFEKTTICESDKACEQAKEPVCEEVGEDEKCTKVRTYCQDFPGFDPVIDPPKEGKDGLLYCRKLLGYEKRITKKLVEDPVKKAAKEARLAAEKAAKDAEVQASKDRKARIKAQVGSANSVAALKAIVKDMVDELVKE